MSSITPPRFDLWLEDARSFSDAQLAREFERIAPSSGSLREAMHYALFAPGKRLRPSLVLLLCEALGGTRDDAGAPAAAVEFVHSYSLVHDDLPCMDDDSLRRGRPTCHVVFGEALALLAGDALLTGAFEILARTSTPLASEGCALLARAAGAEGMVRGQVLDLSLESSAGLDAVRSMHALKTGALISAACELGALAAGAAAKQRESVRNYGRALGACFQAVDDILDVVGDPTTLGKTPGKDAKLERATLVRLAGLDGARAIAEEAAGRARGAAGELGFGPSHPGIRVVQHLLERTR